MILPDSMQHHCWACQGFLGVLDFTSRFPCKALLGAVLRLIFALAQLTHKEV